MENLYGLRQNGKRQTFRGCFLTEEFFLRMRHVFQKETDQHMTNLRGEGLMVLIGVEPAGTFSCLKLHAKEA